MTRTAGRRAPHVPPSPRVLDLALLPPRMQDIIVKLLTSQEQICNHTYVTLVLSLKQDEVDAKITHALP
jgi:hypothetical protein